MADSLAAAPICLRPRDGDPAKLRPIPGHLRASLAPAAWFLYEWTPYVVEWPGATRLQTGSRRHDPIAPGVFLLSFDNQLGLTAIRAHDDRGPLGPPLHVEVIAAKFTNPERSVAFLKQTLTDLFARVSASPFVLGAATERLVRDAHTPPTPLFAYHFFRQHAEEVIHAVQAILGRPHQRLTAEPELVRPHEVRQIDRESLIRLVQVDRSVPVEIAEPRAALTPLQRLRPERIWQALPVETHDTPENRFVLAVCRRLLTAADTLQRARWYGDPGIDAIARERIARVAEHLAMLTHDDRFRALGPMTVTPVHSRVLQRRDGYRDLALLWQRFQRSRQPVFEHLQSSIDLRDIAALYEYWVWFELIDRIKEITGAAPAPLPVPDAFGVPGWTSRVQFGAHGTLHYNRSFHGYSGIWLRPDYVWERADGSLVVMDAKFRMQSPSELLDETGATIGFRDDQRAKSDDLAKMHAYRDAIKNVNAAVVLYPGDVPFFRTISSSPVKATLSELLTGDVEGIGALPMSPIAASNKED